MRNYYMEIDKDGQMFDFKSFYDFIAEKLPDNARIIEIGIANGKSIIYMAEKLFNISKFTDRIIGADNCSYGGQEQRNEIIKNIISSEMKIEFMEISSLDASCKFPDNYFDFIFLDSSHSYEQTKAEILLWFKKLKSETGILAGHDYLSHGEVKKAVDGLIPLFFTRPPLDDTIFEETKVLNIEETENGNGIWWFKKEWFLKLNY